MIDNVKIIFIVKGEKKEFLVPVGTTVLEAAHNNDIDLEGACEGSLACSTCHVIVDKSHYSKLLEPGGWQLKHNTRMKQQSSRVKGWIHARAVSALGALQPVNLSWPRLSVIEVLQFSD